MTYRVSLMIACIGVLMAPVSLSWAAPTADEYRKLADEVESAFRHDVLGVWFPRCVDEHRGGFNSAFARDWSKTGDADPFIVFQSRMTWICATVATHRPDLRDQYLQ